MQVRILSDVGGESGKGKEEDEEIEAETYIWIAGEGKLEKGEWDFEGFRKEKMSAWVGGGEEADEGFAGKIARPFIWGW